MKQADRAAGETMAKNRYEPMVKVKMPLWKIWPCFESSFSFAHIPRCRVHQDSSCHLALMASLNNHIPDSFLFSLGFHVAHVFWSRWQIPYHSPPFPPSPIMISYKANGHYNSAFDIADYNFDYQASSENYASSAANAGPSLYARKVRGPIFP